MSDLAGSHATIDPSAARTISIPWVVLAALLCGLGLFTVAYWLLTGNWLYFAGLLALIAGALMLFHPRSGLDHA